MLFSLSSKFHTTIYHIGLLWFLIHTCSHHPKIKCILLLTSLHIILMAAMLWLTWISRLWFILCVWSAGLEKVKQGIVPQFIWLQRYKLQIANGNAKQQPPTTLNLSSPTSNVDPFGMASFAPLSSPMSPGSSSSSSKSTASTNPFLPHAQTMPNLESSAPGNPAMSRVTSDPILHGYVNMQAQSELEAEKNLMDSTDPLQYSSQFSHPQPPRDPQGNQSLTPPPLDACSSNLDLTLLVLVG